MLKFIEFLRSRPSDATIRSVRALFGLSLGALFVLAAPDYALPFASALGEPGATYAEYALGALAVLPGAVAMAGWCAMKRSHVRRAQIAGAVFLFALSFSVTDTRPVPEVAREPETGTLSASELAGAPEQTSAPAGIDVAFWLGLLGWLPLLSGMTGKMVTEKCLKYGETIQKIRV